MRVTTSGFDKLAAAFERQATSVGPKVRRVVETTAKSIVRDAQIACPVGETGNLRSSITASMSDDGTAAEVGPFAHYGGYVEYGTSRMSPQPYLGPAFTRHEPSFVQALQQCADLPGRG